MNRIACSIVGLGRIASILEDDPLREKPATHAGAIDANPECVLLSGCDPNPDRRELFAKRWNCPNVEGTFDAMLRHGKPDILVIATPPVFHAPVLFRAIRERIPLVICEKPLSDHVREARRMAFEAERSSTVLMVNHERRYSRDYIGVRGIITGNKYGRLLSIHARLYMGRGGTVRAMFFEDGTHLVDIIRFLTGGELTRIRARGDARKANGAIFVSARAAGAPLSIEAACNRDHLVFELDLSFERGRVRIGNGLYEEYESVPSPYYEKFKSLVKKVDNINTAMTGYFSNMLADAVRIVMRNDSTAAVGKEPGPVRPVSNGRDGFLAVGTIVSILARVRAL
jgi:predicted dehydrogenase